MATTDRSSTSKEAAFEKTGATVEDLQHDLQSIRDDMSKLARQVATLIGATGNEAVRRVKAQMNRAKGNLDGTRADTGEVGLDAFAAVRETSGNIAEALEETVRSRPFATLALAMALGFLFGAVWRK